MTQTHCISVSTPSSGPLEKQGAIDGVNIALSTGSCADAYDQVYPIYNSASSDNPIRLAMAATFGCYAGIDLLTVVGDMVTNGGALAGPGFWSFLANEFPSTDTPTDDKKPQAAKNGMDVIFSILRPGTLLIPAYTVNGESNNPGSILSADRMEDGNSYMTFISMALVGSLLSRYGDPLPDKTQGTDLPWTTAALSTGDGCSFAAGILNLYDALQYMYTISPSNVASVYGGIATFLGNALDISCANGCTVLCGGAASCSSCPLTLRNRDSCTGVNTDANSCAAAGIATFVNASWL